MESTAVDLVIIGAGPAGLYAAYYAGFRGFSTAIVDSLEEPGGQVTALYPEKNIFDVAALPVVRGKDLVASLLAQVEPFDPAWHLSQRAEDLTVNGDGVAVTTHVGAELRARAALITGGIGTFTPRPLPGAERWEGRGLRYFVPALSDLEGLSVVIVGGGDSAFDWALALEPIAASVTIVHRRDAFRAHAHTVDLVMRSSVEVVTNTEVQQILGDGRVEAVELRNKVTEEVWTIPAGGIVAALGFVADLGPLSRWGLALEKRRIVTDTRMATNRSRVFAAGDIVTYPGKVPLISVGFGEAATAVNNAATVIDPTLKTFPGHSSEAAPV